MRILHVTREIGSDRRFGIGRSLAPVLDALREAGHEVRYLTQDDLGPTEQQRRRTWEQRLQPWARRMFGIEAEVVCSVWVERINMGACAATVAARDGADIVHLHDPWLALGYAARRASTKAPWGITQHGFGSYTDAIREEGVPSTSRLLRLQRWAEARVLRAADFVVSPTESARQQLARDLAVPAPAPHWVVVVHALARMPTPDRAQARRQLGWSDDEAQVLAVGRLNPVKRIDLIVRACAALGRPVQLTVLGEGDPAPLEQLAQSLGAGMLRLDVRSVSDVAPWLVACDVYVSASRSESFGLANLEALACGAPAVCLAAGAVPEVTGGAAMLLPGQGAQLEVILAQALRTLLDDPARRAELAAVGREHARTWPDATEIARQYEALYRSLA